MNNHALIAAINARKESKFTAKAYPQYEKYTIAEMYRRSGGARCVNWGGGKGGVRSGVWGGGKGGIKWVNWGVGKGGAR